MATYRIYVNEKMVVETESKVEAWDFRNVIKNTMVATGNKFKEDTENVYDRYSELIGNNYKINTL